MTVYSTKGSGPPPAEGQQQQQQAAESVVETRLTGFGVHALILASALAIPMLTLVPLPVVAGVFLYLGRKVMSGNQFLRRCKQLFLDKVRACEHGIHGHGVHPLIMCIACSSSSTRRGGCARAPHARARTVCVPS